MTGAWPADILRQLDESSASTDRDLLARFLRERDQSAFREIVVRHGPFVLSVCRRVTGHRQDAEDAFQAVFLILARKASSIRNLEVLPGWLHKVALRVAQSARRTASRRRAREVAVSVMPEKPAPSTESVAELGAVLDEEVAALPSWYQDAIVLCDLRGVSRQEAAIALRIPEGTLSSRLAKGRKKLAERLTKRGIALSVAAIPSIISTLDAAVLPTELLVKTCGLVNDWMAGGAIPKPLAKLTEGGMTMRKVLIFIVLGSAAVVAGVVYAAQPIQNVPPIEPPKPPAVAKPVAAEQPAPDPKREGKTIVYSSTPRLHSATDLNVINELKAQWNAQGTLVAIEGRSIAKMAKPCTAVQIVTVSDSKTIGNLIWGPLLLNKSRFVGFEPDGKNVLTELSEYQLVSGEHRLDVWQWGGHQERLQRSISLPTKETKLYAFAADGKTFRTLAIEKDPKKTWLLSKIHAMEFDAVSGKRLKSLVTLDSGPYLAYAISANGTRLAVLGADEMIVVYDVDRAAKLSSFEVLGSLKRPPEQPNVTAIVAPIYDGPSLSFSPDGHRVILCRGIGGNYVFLDNRGNYTDRVAIWVGGIGQTVVLNADTGEPLPPLEGGEYLDTFAGSQAFSEDGRLLALSGQCFTRIKEAGKDLAPNLVLLEREPKPFLTVWDTKTGKTLTSWDRSVTALAFNPRRPLLAVLEPNDTETRLGLWDFTAEMADEK